MYLFNGTVVDAAGCVTGPESGQDARKRLIGVFGQAPGE